MSGACMGNTPISPSTPGMTTESTSSEKLFASGVTISRRTMRQLSFTMSMPPFM